MIGYSSVVSPIHVASCSPGICDVMRLPSYTGAYAARDGPRRNAANLLLANTRAISQPNMSEMRDPIIPYIEITFSCHTSHKTD